MITVIDYAPQHAGIFKSLNLQWLDRFELTESHDLLILNNPRELIIDPGGFIFLAAVGEVIVGTAALIKTGSHEFELAKMTVDVAYRRKGISKMLIEKCILQAKSSGASHLHLVSNHQLKEAIALYEQYGFKHTPVKPGPFLTADISMELNLTVQE
jgi:ribosomal protein S18 acetylase RimI-like enzyme